MNDSGFVACLLAKLSYPSESVPRFCITSCEWRWFHHQWALQMVTEKSFFLQWAALLLSPMIRERDAGKALVGDKSIKCCRGVLTAACVKELITSGDCRLADLFNVAPAAASWSRVFPLPDVGNNPMVSNCHGVLNGTYEA